jgi:hypothetical protein
MYWPTFIELTQDAGCSDLPDGVTCRKAAMSIYLHIIGADSQRHKEKRRKKQTNYNIILQHETFRGNED